MKRDKNNNRIKELEDFRSLVYDTIGKKDNLKVQDFEKFLQRRYGAKSYNSLQALHRSCGYEPIEGDIRDYVDYLAFDIVSSNYKVAEVKGKKFFSNDTESTCVFYGYDDNNDITDIFTHDAGLIGCGNFGIFAAGGYNARKKEIKDYCCDDSSQNEDDILKMLE